MISGSEDGTVIYLVNPFLIIQFILWDLSTYNRKHVIVSKTGVADIALRGNYAMFSSYSSVTFIDLRDMSTSTTQVDGPLKLAISYTTKIGVSLAHGK